MNRSNPDNLYTEIFLMAAEFVTLKKQNKEANFEQRCAYSCFYQDNKKLIFNPLKPSAIEKAYVVNKFLKLTDRWQQNVPINEIKNDSFSGHTNL